MVFLYTELVFVRKNSKGLMVNETKHIASIPP